MPLGLTEAQWRRFLALEPDEQRELIQAMTPADALTFDADFEAWAHDNQHPPPSEGWRVWLMMAGRGFGKTRAGAEWVQRLAETGGKRIALVGASIDEARSVMIEGPSGLLTVARRRRVRVEWEPSLRRLSWPKGSTATLFSGDHPDGLRGPEHHYAWVLTFEVEADEGPVSMLELFEDASGGVIDVQDGRSVAGFAAHGTSVRDALDLLSGVCGVDLVERDGKLRSPSVISPLPLDDDELGCDADAEARPRVERSRAPDSALPSSLAMAYYDAGRDYQAGQMRTSAGGGRTRDERIELPAVLAAPEAKQLVEQALSRRWRSGDRLRLRLPPSRIGLRPGDAIQLPGSAQAWTVRAVSIEGMAVAVEAEAAPVTVQPLPADAGRSVSEPDLAPGRTELLLFELPDFGEAPSASIRVHVAASNEGLWKAVPIELSAGQLVPNSLILARRAIAGRTESLLEPRAPLVLDDLSSVQVRLINSNQALFNADMDGLMAGANVAVIGQELVQFGRADQLEPGVYRLSRLLRGRRGTAWAAPQHAIGEIFCLLDPAQVRTFDLPASAPGVELHGTAYGIGDIAPQPVASRLLTGESMRPPSPCHLQVGRSGSNLAVEWVRRSYRGWHWIDGIGDGGDAFPELYRLTIQGTGGILSVDCSQCSTVLDALDLPGEAGQPISLSVATVGPSALSRPAMASFIL